MEIVLALQNTGIKRERCEVLDSIHKYNQLNYGLPESINVKLYIVNDEKIPVLIDYKKFLADIRVKPFVATVESDRGTMKYFSFNITGLEKPVFAKKNQPLIIDDKFKIIVHVKMKQLFVIRFKVDLNYTVDRSMVTLIPNPPISISK